jgi:hypothetical protein
LADLSLDRKYFDWLVIAERQVGQEIHIQRCLYHFHDDE